MIRPNFSYSDGCLLVGMIIGYWLALYTDGTWYDAFFIILGFALWVVVAALASAAYRKIRA